MATNITYPILNPNVYLNFLPPKTASQFELARNIRLATIGALLWDILVFLPDDLKIIFRIGLRPTMISFILTRVFSLSFITLSVVKKTRPVANCNAIELGEACSAMITIMTYSFLFLRRVQAIWAESKIVKHFFSFLWLVNACVLVVLPLGAHAIPMAGTGYCANQGMNSWVSLSAIVPLVFDSLVFLAISYKLATEYSLTSGRITWTAIISGNALPLLARAVLQGGQQYYLISVIANILITIMIMEPALIPVYQAALMTPSICLISSMACRVFRNLKMAADHDRGPALPTTVHSIRFRHTTVGTTTSPPDSDRSLDHAEKQKTMLESPVPPA